MIELDFKIMTTNNTNSNRYEFLSNIGTQCYKALVFITKNLLWVFISISEIIITKLLEIFQAIKTKL